MTIERFWNSILKRWPFLFCFILAVTLLAFFVSKMLSPTYQSTVLVQISLRSSDAPEDYSSLLASGQLVQTESRLATSDPVLREVATHYPDLTSNQLAKQTSATPKVNTQLFEISVFNANAQRAADLANDIASVLIKQQKQIIQEDQEHALQKIQQEIDQIKHEMDSITDQLNNIHDDKASQIQKDSLQNQLISLQQQYNQWQSSLAQLELAQAQGGNFLRIAQSAQPAETPVQPNITLNTLAGTGGSLLVGMIGILLLDIFDKRIRNVEEIKELFHWPLLGTIWTQSEKSEGGLINPTGTHANVEAYRILRTNIGFAGIDKPLRFIMVTSALPGEGKSTIAANLAIFLARAGKNTLLIDADMRRPTLHQKFHLPGDRPGLSNAVLTCGMPAMNNSLQFVGLSPAAQSSIPMALVSTLEAYMYPVGISNLRVMPSGPLPPNPSELLDSKAMMRLFMALECCDSEIVIFDTPPLIDLSDASILASRVDGSVLVMDLKRTKKDVLSEMNVILEQSGATVLGCVMNWQVKRRGRSSNDYYDYYAGQKAEASLKPGRFRPQNGTIAPPTPFPEDSDLDAHKEEADHG